MNHREKCQVTYMDHHSKVSETHFGLKFHPQMLLVCMLLVGLEEQKVLQLGLMLINASIY